MSAPLDELYLTWLYSQVGSVKLKSKSRTYWALLRQLYTKEFVWHIPHDDNRVEDGRDLRIEFLHSEGLDADPEWIDLGCSILELLVCLARVLSFETDGEPRVWFWELINNLGIYCTDENYNGRVEQEIDDILNTFIDRTYSSSGRGGLFPLRNAQQDQREVELWYQANAYLLERF